MQRIKQEIAIKFNKEKFRKLCQKYNFSLVVLHGSYAKSSFSKISDISDISDIDVAFLGEPGIIKKRYFDILRDFSAIFGDKFDPVFINGAEAMITYQIAIAGKPLYEKKRGIFNSFRIAAIGRYMDTKKFRLLEKEYIKSAIQKPA